MASYIICLALGLAVSALTHTQSSAQGQKGAVMAKHASGTFGVKITPQAPEEHVGDPTIGRLSIDKQFHGDLEATSLGQVLAAGTDVKDSAGYVAIERVRGTLRGRRGTFALQHTGTMNRGVPGLSVTVVPDSGTEQLVGLAGTMTINLSFCAAKTSRRSTRDGAASPTAPFGCTSATSIATTKRCWIFPWDQVTDSSPETRAEASRRISSLGASGSYFKCSCPKIGILNDV